MQFLLNIRKSGGRNNRGRITSFHRGGGYKRFIKYVDHKHSVYGIPCKVIKIIKSDVFFGYKGYYALVYYVSGIFSIVVATHEMQEGMYIVSGNGYNNFDFISRMGSSKLLHTNKVGDVVCDIEVVPGDGGVYARACGTYGTVLKTHLNVKDVLVRLPSKEIRIIDGYCRSVLGRISNIFKREEIIGKAGIRRNSGWRPVVRGVAMNPIDHPHGGNTAGGRPSVSPWGKLTKGQPTRKRSKRTVNIFLSRRAALKVTR